MEQHTAYGQCSDMRTPTWDMKTLCELVVSEMSQSVQLVSDMSLGSSVLVSVWASPVSEKISVVQPASVSELQRVVDRTRDEDFTHAVVQWVLAVQCSAAQSNWQIVNADEDFEWTSAVSASYCVETRC
jgi:hypothetical protein